MKKAIFFDWSGTLSDNLHCFAQVCNAIFDDFGREHISKEEIRLNFITPYMNFWNKYLPDLSKEKQCELYDKYIQNTDAPKLFEGVTETLEYLQDAGWKLFVISSDPYSILTPEAERLKLAKFFDDIIGEAHEKGDSILKLQEKYGLDLEQSYFVGDTTGDIDAGKYANTKTIGLSWGFLHRDILAKSEPDFLIDDIIEIRSVVGDQS